MSRCFAILAAFLVLAGTCPAWPRFFTPAFDDPDIPDFDTQPVALDDVPVPDRDETYRGGVWNSDTLAALGDYQAQEVASLGPTQSADPILSEADDASSATVTGDPKAGPGFEWEATGPGGGSPAVDAHVVTNTGNRFMAVPLMSYPVKGGRLAIELTLYHNSLGQYGTLFGQNWGCDYDAGLYTYVPINGGHPEYLLRWGNGQAIPINWNSTTNQYQLPTGIHLTFTTGTMNTITTPDKVQYKFSSTRLVQIVDRCGYSININRGGDGRITTVTSGDGRSLAFAYNAAGQVASVTDPLGRVWNFGYSTNYRLNSIQYPPVILNGVRDTRTFFYKGDSNCINKETDLRGFNWQMDYDASNRFLWSQAPTAGSINRLTYAYFTGYTTFTLPDARRGAATYRHDYNAGKFWKVTDPDGYQIQAHTDSYNVFDYLITKYVVDGYAKTSFWQFTHDGNGNITSVIDPLNRTVSAVYNSFGDPTSITQTPSDGSGALTTTIDYNADGNLTEVRDSLSHVLLHNDYDVTTKLLTSTRDGSASDTSALTTTISYDGYGNVWKLTTPSGTDEYHYDLLGRVDWFKDGMLRKTSYAYDGRGRVKTITRPDLTSHIDLLYDHEDHLLQWLTDELGRQSELHYDWSQRLDYFANARIDLDTGLHDVERYGYDHNDWLISVTNGRNKTRSYTYTKRGDLTKLTMPTSSYEMWSYGPFGEVRAYQHLRGGGGTGAPTIKYKFDLSFAMTDIVYPSGTIPYNTTFHYDGHGRLDSMADITGTSTWHYDTAGRLDSFGQPNAGVFSYTFYDSGKPHTVGMGAFGTITYGYDTSGRVNSVVSPLGTSTITYNAANQIIQAMKPNRLWSNYTYDSMGRLWTINHKRDNFDLLRSETYGYNAADDLTSKIVDGVTTLYGYDEVHQLTSESCPNPNYSYTYKYDENGNREERNGTGGLISYAYDNDDRLLSAGGTVYTYDTYKRPYNISGGGVTKTLSWDIEDRLIGATVTGQPNASYSYNGAGARVRTDITGGASKIFWRNGADVLSPVVGDGTYRITPGIGMEAGATKRSFLADHLGTHAAEVDATGLIVSSNSYTAFGSRLNTPRQGLSPHGFAGDWGYLEDDTTGFQCVGHRVVDGSTGRFLTRDPMMHGRNWYRYVDNTPLRFVDPAGLQSLDSIRAYVSNLWRTFKSPRAILEELGDLEESGMVSRVQLNRISQAKNFFQQFENDLPRLRNVANFIRQRASPPQGLKGGIRFWNLEGKLPKGVYREFDVFPKGTAGRGAERLVIDSAGRTWYSPDHYKTFFEITELLGGG